MDQNTLTKSLIGETIVGGIRETSYLLLRDFDATQDQVVGAKVNDCGRAPIHLLCELIGFNRLVAKGLQGEPSELLGKDSVDRLEASFGNRSEARAAYEESVEAVCKVIEAYSDEEWSKKVKAPWGREVTKAHLASWINYHAMYHDGQICYVQTLHGDNEVHWM